MSKQKKPMTACEMLRGAGVGDFRSQLDIPKEAEKSFNAAMANWIMNDAHGFWYEKEDEHGDGHTDPHAFVYEIGMRIENLCHAYNGPSTQSPIEDMLLAALLWMDVDWAGFPKFDEVAWDGGYQLDPADLKYFITPQAKLGPYKVDFMIWFAFKGMRYGLVVECDGHDFHEKNKEQAARDKKRDREILTAGYPTLRFTGSEVYKDTLLCVEQIHTAVANVLYRISKDGGLFGSAA